MTLSIRVLVLLMLNVVMLNVANKPFMLSVIMLNVVMLSVIMLNVVAPFLWLVCWNSVGDAKQAFAVSILLLSKLLMADTQ